MSLLEVTKDHCEDPPLIFDAVKYNLLLPEYLQGLLQPTSLLVSPSSLREAEYRGGGLFQL